MSNAGPAAPVLTGCTFSGNSAGSAGAMVNHASSAPVLNDCVFSSNTATYGGAVFNDEVSSASMTNCVFLANSATDEGGGLLNAQSAEPTLMNCTFTGNSAQAAGAVSNVDSAMPILTNCILWGDTPDEFHDGDDATVTYSDIQGGHPGKGNIKANPLFVNAASGNVRLEARSPAIDVGTAQGAPDADIDGEPRPSGAGIDMGAHEFTGSPAEGEGENDPGGGCIGSSTGKFDPAGADDTAVRGNALLAALVMAALLLPFTRATRTS